MRERVLWAIVERLCVVGALLFLAYMSDEQRIDLRTVQRYLVHDTTGCP